MGAEEVSDRVKAGGIGAALFIVWALAPDPAAGAAAETAVEGFGPAGWLVVLVVLSVAAWGVWRALRAAALRAYRRRRAAELDERVSTMRSIRSTHHLVETQQQTPELSVSIHDLREEADLDAWIERTVHPWQQGARAAGYRRFESVQEGDRFIWRAYR